MIAGQLEIQLLANMARLNSDMDKAKLSVGSAVGAMNKILGTIGVGVSLNFFTSMIKSVANAGDKLNDLRKITGLTIAELGGLERVAKLNGTNLDAVARSVGLLSKKMFEGAEVFNLMGIATKTASGDLRNVNQVLLDVADRFSRMENGAAKSAIANQLFGKSGRDLIPMLSEGRQKLEESTAAYARNSGMTLQTAEASDRFNDILLLLSGRVTATKTTFVSGLLPALNDIGGAFLKLNSSTNIFNQLGQGLGVVLKAVAIAAVTAFGALKSFGFAIDGVIKQFVALINLDPRKAIEIGNKYFDVINKDAKATALFVKSIVEGDKEIAAANAGQKKLLDFHVQLPAALDKTTQSVQRQERAFNIEIYKLREYQREMERARAITLSIATAQDIYNAELEELNRLRPYLSAETYGRALQNAQDELNKTSVVTKATTDDVSQLWMQAGRNIQSTLANSIFNFFDDGLKGMVKNLGIALGRIASEFAALRIAQSIGLAGMFGGGAENAAASGGNLLNLAGGASLIKSGFGLPGMIGRGASMLGGAIGSSSLGAFGGGMMGIGATGASTAAFSTVGGAGTAFIGGAGTALGGTGMGATAGLGSSFGAFAGPLAGIGAGVFGGSMIAGDKKLGPLSGTSSAAIGTAIGFAAGGPIGAVVGGLIGGLTNALFGHGPFKFRQQVAIGEATGEGFEGRVTDVFRAKGGLLVGNKHREQAAQNESDLLDLFSTTIKGYADASRGFAKNLGLDAEVINGFSKTIRLESEKGKTLTEEAIRQMLAGIGNEIAESVLPVVGTLKKSGEDSIATLSRLNSEFLTLKQGAENLGASVDYAKDLITGMSFEARTAFVDAAGGLESLAGKTQFFANNFLTDAERLATAQKHLNDALEGTGLSANSTRDEFKNLVQTSDEFMIKLLDLAPAFVSVTDAMQTSADTAGALAKTKATNNTQRTLEIELMELQGKTQEALTAKRIDELMVMVMDSSLIPLQQAIFSQRDFNTAAEKANKQRLLDIDTAKNNLSTVFGSVDEAFSALQRAIEADKNKILSSNAEIELKRDAATEAYNKALDAQNTTINQFADSIRDLQGFSDSLKSTIESINPMSMESARSQIESAIKTGNLNTANVASAISILAKTETSGFTSVLEFKRAQAKNIQLLSDLSNSTEVQLTLEQRTLSALESARDRLTDSFKTETALLDDQIKSNAGELSRLDQIVSDAKTQIDVLRGIDVSIISVSAALGNLKTQSAAVAGASAGVAAAQAVAEILPQIAVPQIIAPQITTPATSPLKILPVNAVNAQQTIWLAGEREREERIDREYAARNIARFDIGGTVPKTGIAMVHKNEQVLTVDDKNNIAKQLEEMRGTMEVLTVATNKLKRIFEKWDGAGIPATRAA